MRLKSANAQRRTQNDKRYSTQKLDENSRILGVVSQEDFKRHMYVAKPGFSERSIENKTLMIRGNEPDSIYTNPYPVQSGKKLYEKNLYSKIH